MATSWQEQTVAIDGFTLELRTKGEGPALVILQGEEIGREMLPFHNLLAERFQVLVPSLPGLGRSELPSWVDSVDDLAYVMLDFMEKLHPSGVHLLGIGFGDWVAAEMAVRCQVYLKRLILADAFGIKISEPWVRDIADLFVIPAEEHARLAWHDPAKAGQMKVPGMADLSETELTECLLNRQAVLALGWKPFMHNPKLRRRLARIRIPTLIIWGESDRVVSPDYGRAYHEAVPDSKFQLISQSGHYPHLEQPGGFVRAVAEFLL